MCCLCAVVDEIHVTRPATCKLVCREFPRLCFACKRKKCAAAAAAAAKHRADQWQQRIAVAIDQLLQCHTLTRKRVMAFLRGFPASKMSAAYATLLLRIGLCAVCVLCVYCALLC